MTASSRPAAPALRALLLVPGALETPTGGYGYARALLAHAASAGLMLDHWPLPDGFPHPTRSVLAETTRRMRTLPAGWPAIIDGLALGCLSPDTMRAHDGPVIGLCHHPLGLETGLSPAASRTMLEAEHAALGACAGVITTSRATAELLTRRLGVPSEQITVAPPGTRPAVPARGSGGGSEVALLSVGSLSPRKGHDVLIEALARLADLPWRLTIVGGALAGDERTAGQLRSAIARHGLDQRVHLTGSVDAEALDERYAESDLFVLASRFEGFGMAYAEAMAHGLPVVGTEAGAVAEATLGAARLVPPDDPGALAAALRPLIADRDARARLAASCAEAGRRLPTWQDTARQVAAAVAAAASPARAATA